ncbi:hypothetical protein [Devosia sp.]|uniref:hypothetical protein n=1 Tax=Devosia sp. TaxID=1871048 RepID=UPI001B22C73F|nr:hypothetical protein [Devosia sp.]MBO9590440.1 hypothetical protein [Devosia sp.]
MKSSLIAITTALALSIGGTAAIFAQESTTAPTTLEECLVQEGAGATAPGESLQSDSDGDSEATTDTPPAQGPEPALGEAVVCPDVEDSAN